VGVLSSILKYLVSRLIVMLFINSKMLYDVEFLTRNCRCCYPLTLKPNNWLLTTCFEVIACNITKAISITNWVYTSC